MNVTEIVLPLIVAGWLLWQSWLLDKLKNQIKELKGVNDIQIKEIRENIKNNFDILSNHITRCSDLTTPYKFNIGDRVIRSYIASDNKIFTYSGKIVHRGCRYKENCYEGIRYRSNYYIISLDEPTEHYSTLEINEYDFKLATNE